MQDWPQVLVKSPCNFLPQQASINNGYVHIHYNWILNQGRWQLWGMKFTDISLTFIQNSVTSSCKVLKLTNEQNVRIINKLWQKKHFWCACIGKTQLLVKRMSNQGCHTPFASEKEVCVLLYMDCKLWICASMQVMNKCSIELMLTYAHGTCMGSQSLFVHVLLCSLPAVCWSICHCSRKLTPLAMAMCASHVTLTAVQF